MARADLGKLRRELDGGAERLLLWLWKVLPLPLRARRAYLELTHPRFLVGVMALIRDEAGQVLILEHTYRRAYPWGLPGGYLKQREQPEAGLAREVVEETGLTVQIGTLLAAGLYNPHQLDLLFEARIVSGDPRASAEVRAWRFVPEQDLMAILPNQLAMLKCSRILLDSEATVGQGDGPVRPDGR